MGAYGSPELYPNNNNQMPEYEKYMIYCQKCGTKYNKKLKRCPQCGTKPQGMFYNKWWFWLIVAFLVIAYFPNSNQNTNTQNNKDIPIQNNDNYDIPTYDIEEFAGYITMDKFNQIKNGMTYRQVTGIIGCEGELTSSYNYDGYDFAIYTWYGNGSIGANANVTFENGKVSGKAQFGLN